MTVPSHQNPEMNALVSEFNTLVEKIRTTALKNNTNVSLNLPNQFRSVFVLTPSCYDDYVRWGYFEKGDPNYTIGQWVSSNDFC